MSERAIDDVGMSPTCAVRASTWSVRRLSVCNAPIRCLCATIVLRRSDSANRRSATGGIAPDERKSSLVVNGGSHFVARCNIILQGIHFQKDIHILFPARSCLEVSVHGRGRDGNGSFKVVADATYLSSTRMPLRSLHIGAEGALSNV